MDFWSSLPIPLFLLLSAAALMVLHARTWKALGQQELEPAERDFHRRQFRRRMQSSAMLGILAVGIFVGQLISDVAAPTVVLLYWGGVGLLAVWVGLLALADIVATKYHYGRMRQGFVIEQAKLQAKLRRIEQARSNGKSQAKGKSDGVERKR